ncbi:MAG: hypothetical protein AAFW89_12950 [Bacteroidota bacterium]
MDEREINSYLANVEVLLNEASSMVSSLEASNKQTTPQPVGQSNQVTAQSQVRSLPITQAQAGLVPQTTQRVLRWVVAGGAAYALWTVLSSSNKEDKS